MYALQRDAQWSLIIKFGAAHAIRRSHREDQRENCRNQPASVEAATLSRIQEMAEGHYVLLQRIFGPEAYPVNDFKAVSFVFKGAYMIGDQEPFERTYRAALSEASEILTSIYEELEEYGWDSDS